MWTRLAAIVSILFLVTDGAAALAADPPGRVGRLSLIEGTVSLRTEGQPAEAANTDADAPKDAQTDEWVPATLNYPVTTGNSLWTESGARAEVQVGSAEVRMTEQTELEILRLDDQSVELALHQGAVNLHLDALLPGGLRIDTPRGPITFSQPGSYRIAVDTNSANAADSVEVATFTGEAQISAESANRSDIHTVKRGEAIKLSGEPANVVVGPANTTSFDQWAMARDPQPLAQTAARTVNPSVSPAPMPAGQTISPVSPQMTGYQDLARNGSWEQAPSYGAVWYPTAVVDDWAPYRYGHWAYVAPWGWTWIDDAPWGFTPFHYGRWVHVGHRWAWWPGQRAVRPVYAPALVAFVGGNGWSVNISSGRGRPVGWVPLAPYEVYRPHYRTSATYIRNVNITTVNKTVINNITVNKNIEVNKFANRGAATVVSSESFARGRKVNEAKIDVPRKQIEQARVTNDVRRVAPAAVASRTEAPRPREVAHFNEDRRAPSPVNAQARTPTATQRDERRAGPSQDRSRDQVRETVPQPAQQNSAKDSAPVTQPPAREDRRAAPDREQRREQANERREAAPRPQQQERTKEPGAAPSAPATQPAAPEERRAGPPDRDQRRERGRDHGDQSGAQTVPVPTIANQQPNKAQEFQQREQAQQRQRQAVEQQQRQVQEQERQRGQAEAQQRQAQEQQQRQEVEQRRQAQDQHVRQQAEQQQRQAQGQQQRQQAEQQQRQQAEQQQRQAHEQQQRQAQEQQQRQQADQQRQRDQSQLQQLQRDDQARDEQRRGRRRDG